MVIVSSSGFKKDVHTDLLKLIKNKKVFVCNNAIDRAVEKNEHFEIIKKNVDGYPEHLECGELTANNALKYVDFYDCIYLSEGSLRSLSEMVSDKEVRGSLLWFINKGKMFITEGQASHILSEDLEYLNFIVNSIEEVDDNYKFQNYSKIKTLNITKEKFIVHIDKLIKSFRGACKLAEKKYRSTLRFLRDGDFLVL